MTRRTPFQSLCVAVTALGGCMPAGGGGGPSTATRRA